MTKDEIKALVSAKLAGQGNQVDLGNALPTILNAIVDLIPTDPPDPPEPQNAPLKFTATGASTLGISNEGDNAPVLFKSSNGVDWEPWDYSDISLGDGESIYIRGENSAFSSSRNKYSTFTGSGSLNVEGNIMSLLGVDAIDIPEGCFVNLFNENTAIIDASDLLLPATTVAAGCYSNMFSGCTSLESAPELPATTLAEGCYISMFSGCTSLVSAPELPATTLDGLCYASMFSECTSLESAPELPATTIAVECYNQMFSGCTSLVNAPELPAITLAKSCYSEMFAECTSLVNAPELPATTLDEFCYYEMFNGCTSLVNAPELPAITLAKSCYSEMFYGCLLIDDITIKATTIDTDSLFDWLMDTAESGTIHCDSTMVATFESDENTPAGWTVSAYN